MLSFSSFGLTRLNWISFPAIFNIFQKLIRFVDNKGEILFGDAATEKIGIHIHPKAQSMWTTRVNWA